MVGFVEESDEHQLLIAGALLEGGAGARTSTASRTCPTTACSTSGASLARATQLRAVDSRLGVRLGLCICEDFWHLPVPYLLALDGAQVLINISSSPGRDIAAVVEGGLGTAQSWRTLMRAYAQLTTSFVIFVNRVGVEEVGHLLGRLAGHRSPAGDVLFAAPLLEPGLFTVRHRP